MIELEPVYRAAFAALTRATHAHPAVWGALAALGVLAAALAGAGGSAAPAPAQEGEPARRAQPTVLITGANRGLGLEWARQFHAAGARVIGTARRPEEAEELRGLGVRVEPLDVTDPQSVRGLAERIGADAVDILVNNAGALGREQSIETLDAEALENYFQVNCLGPMRVTQALLPALRRGERKLVVNITSRLASLELNAQGGYYGYRESKAALNMFTRSLARELAAEGFTCVALSPGWVRTQMGGPQAPLSPQESVQAMRAVLEKLTPRDTGRFLDHRGETLPW